MPAFQPGPTLNATPLSWEGVDAFTQRIKRGGGGKAGGSARRLSDVLEQFDLTWDLFAATVGESVAVMPKEFAQFLN